MIPEQNDVSRTADQQGAGIPGSDTHDLTGAYQPAPDTEPNTSAPVIELPTIDGYEVVALLAKGGMGCVFAGREIALDREVAIKTLLPGANSERFVTESKITARLPHPGIPPVYALGKLADGAPFLAMKLVRGKTLSALLKERDSPQSDLPRFAQIFEQITQAVGFAHAQGIVHRDLKPLNVMVGAFGEVQVMDWGLAREGAGRDSVSSVVSENAELTAYGAVLGTPGYMAPEQARGEPVDVRADVFALGSTLAAILTGQPAFVGSSARETIEKASRAHLDEVMTRLNASGADAELVALARTCMAADAADRPKNGLEVADRVAAYRTGVEARLQQARADEAAARTREAEQRRRRRALQWAGGVVSAVLLLGIAGTTYGLLVAREQTRIATRETDEKEKARQAEADRADGEFRAKIKEQEAAAAEKEANRIAQKRLAEVAKSNEILGSIFDSLDPKEVANSKRPLQAILVEKLDRAVAQLEGESIGDPRVVATMQARFGRSLLALNEPGKAIVLFEKARQTLKGEVGADDPETLACMLNLAFGYLEAGKQELALQIYQEVVQRARSSLGPNHPATNSATHDLAYCLMEGGKSDQAIPMFQDSLQWRREHLGPTHDSTLANMSNLARAYKAAGQLERATTLLEQTLEVTRSKLGAKHPHTLVTVNNLALAYEAAGKWDQALPLMEQTLQLRQELLGPDNTDTLGAINNLALGYQKAGKASKALPLLENLFKLTKEKFGVDHPRTLIVMRNLAVAYQDGGSKDKALPLMEAELKLTRAKLGPEHPDTLMSINNLGAAYLSAGRMAEAIPLLKDSLEIKKVKLGPDHPDTLMTMNNLAGCYMQSGNLDQALPLMKETLELLKAKVGADHPNTIRTMNNLASIYMRKRQFDQAVPLFEQAVKVLRDKAGPEHPTTVAIQNNLLKAYEEWGKPSPALTIRQQNFERMKEKLGADHRDTLQAANELARQYWLAKQLDKSIPLFEEVARAFEAKFGRDDANTLLVLANLGVNYKDAGQLDKSLPLLEEAYRASAKLPMLRVVEPQLLDGYLKAGKTKQAEGLVKNVLESLRKQFPKESPQLAGSLAQLALSMTQAKAFDMAEPFLRECLAIREKAQPDVWTTYNTQSTLGGALLGQKKYADAEPLLLKGYEGMKQREKTIPKSGGGELRIPEALDRLVELYTATNKPDEVKKWQAERAKFVEPVEKGPMPREVK